MKIIADASVFLAVVLNEPEKQQIIEKTKGAEIISSEVLPYEIGNALIAMLKRKRLTKEEIKQSYSIFEMIPVGLFSADIQTSLEIASTFNIYAYDAYYLELAQKLNLPLLTLDKQMKENAQRLNIKIVE